MILIDNVLVSDEVIDRQFVCNLSACKGECCIQGESGAPLEEDEKALIEQSWNVVKDFVTPEGREAVEQQGYYIVDKEDGIAKTTLTGGAGGPCAYVNYGKDGITYCGIERAWEDGKIHFRKPISCHLYPIRVKHSGGHDFINYFEWDICDPACALGESLKVPVYRFLKEPLVRKYGAEFFETLEAAVKHMEEGEESKSS